MFLRKNVLWLLALVAFTVGILVSVQVIGHKEDDLSQFHGTLLETPRHIAPFHLTGIDGKPFDQNSLKGQWTFMFFGFTNCGAICPTTMAELTKMYHLLKEEDVSPLPRVMMVSIDPERDTQSQLAHYVKAFNVSFYGAYGSSKTISEMTHEIGIAYIKIANAKKPKNYDIEHTGTVMLFNPQGQLNAFFTLPHRANLMAKDYQLLINQGTTYS